MFTKVVEEVRYSKPRGRTDFFFLVLNFGFVIVLVCECRRLKILLVFLIVVLVHSVRILLLQWYDIPANLWLR